MALGSAAPGTKPAGRDAESCTAAMDAGAALTGGTSTGLAVSLDARGFTRTTGFGRSTGFASTGGTISTAFGAAGTGAGLAGAAAFAGVLFTAGVLAALLAASFLGAGEDFFV